MAQKGYSVGVTETFEFVTFNLPADELTPGGATLLLTVDQARTLSNLLTSAANMINGLNMNPGQSFGSVDVTGKRKGN